MTTTKTRCWISTECCSPISVLAILALILPLGLMRSAVGAEPSTQLPNILWLIAENMGPDLGCYGTEQVATPNLDRLARQGVRYTRAFATAPVCSTSRSAFMTGMHQTSIGSQNHATREEDRLPLPPGVRPVTYRLRDAGYYIANLRHLTDDPELQPFFYGTCKTHLNFQLKNNRFKDAFWIDGDLFDSDQWNDLKDHQPFFAQVNFPNVERSVSMSDGDWKHRYKNPKHADPAKVILPPYYPDTPDLRKDWAGYLDAVSGLDKQVGQVLQRLDEDGLADNTIVIFFADNGRLEARGLDWCYDSGLHVPMIVRWPEALSAPQQYHAGTTQEALVSLLDVTASTLSIAGIPKPAKLHGRVLFGPSAGPARKYVFGARDRTDEAVNRIRTVRSMRYRYIRNFMPEKAFMAPHVYKDAHFPVYRVLKQFQKEGKLTPAQATLTAPRLPDEELYDIPTDPYEVKNLAKSSDPAHQHALKELRAELDHWIEETNDQGRVLEPPETIDHWKRTMDEQHKKYLK